ncbi:SpoIIE family protein phosphatase [Streptomyces sp. NPDC048603]|uniref:SpoIIE family protein phosphatase n=1 Tax=Streptomyces sp. NPDC048603 TaxID=3365577 RepID=UPI003723A32E
MHDPLFHDPSGVFTESGDETYALMDVHGVLLGLGPGAEALLGWSAEELRGRRAADLLYTRSDAAGIMARCGTDPVAELGPAVLRHRTGHPVDVTLRARPMMATGGDRQWLVQIVESGAARRRELGDALLRGMFTDSPAVIDVFDTELRFLAQNAAQRSTGTFAGVDFTGRTMAEVAPDGLLDLDAFEARQRHVLETGEAQIAEEVHGRTPADPYRDHVWSESILPLRSRAGEVIALAHVVVDATDRARARERLALVNDASTRIGTTLNVLRTAQELVDLAVPQFADHSYVNLLDPVFGGEEPTAGPTADWVPLRRAASSVAEAARSEAMVPLGEVDAHASARGSPTRLALAGGEPRLMSGQELIDEFAPADPARADLVREYGVHSWLLVPMFARGAALGTAVFVRSARAHPFEPDDVMLAEEFVARAAVCIDNASRYTRERTTALALQRSLLPQRLPDLGAVDAVARYVPATGHTVLGGAWYDVIPLSGARVALVVGDVAGHGLHSAVTMGRLRTAVRTLADLDLAPEELLGRLDDQVNRFHDEHGQGLAGSGAAGTSCVYAVFDPVSRRCGLAGAGHPPPALLSADGSVEFLELPDGPVLGGSGLPFESREVTLDDGQLLVFYTEGLVTAAEENLAAGQEQLRAALAALPADGPGRDGGGLESACDRLMGRLLPTLPHDDAALLMVRVHGLDGDHQATWELAAQPAEVGRARALATAKLAEWELEELSFNTEVVVSELVTNAVRYGSPPVRLRMIRDRELIVEVSDGASTSPHIRRALETDEGGRGLFMVAQLTQLWGTRYHDRGKTIWAEQSFPDTDGDGAAPPGFPDFQALWDAAD